MKRNQAARSSKMDSYEHVLMCLICRSLFDDHDHQPKFLPCHHTFCKDCLREFVRQMGDEIECPSCRKPATIPAAGVAALQTNFYAKYIQSLVYGVGALGCSPSVLGDGCGDSDPECQSHESEKAQYFCRQCSRTACDLCFSADGPCSGHQRQPLVAAAEDFQGKIDGSFTRANTVIEQKKVELEARLKAFSEEKDRALLKIDAAFESHVHLLNRRATLLKNKVIDSYNERVTSFESDLEEISTAMTCIISLKEFHETAISRGQLEDVEKGVEELNEVFSNVENRIHPRPYHVLFEERHGIERFKCCVKDLGKVTCFAGAVGPLDGKNSSMASGDDDPPDTTPSSPHAPSSGGFHERPPGDRKPVDSGGNDDSNEERPRPEGQRNGSTSDAVRMPEEVRGWKVDGRSESRRNNVVQSSAVDPKSFPGSKNESDNINRSINNNRNDNIGRGGSRGIVDFISTRLQRPCSARVKKAFEKIKNDEADDKGREGEGGPDSLNARNSVMKGLASPVRRPKFLISPDGMKLDGGGRNPEIFFRNLV